MFVKVKLERIHVNDEADGCGNAEPFLWPIFFKIDKDALQNPYIDTNQQVPYGQIPWFKAPSGAHGNLGGDVDEGDDIQVPAAIGEASFPFDPGLVPTDTAQVATLVVLLEEDDFPSNSDIEQYYGEYAQRVADTIRQKVKTALVAAINPTPENTAAASMSGGSIENDIASELKSRLTHSLVNVDDFIGVKLFSWTWEQLVADPVQSFSVAWNSSTGSEDGAFTLHGKVEATGIPIRAAIYQHSNFNGKVKTFAPGKYDVVGLGIGNDELSSLRVPHGWIVALYMHHQFTGDAMIFTQDAAYVGDQFNDQTSSLVVADGPRAIVFQHSDYKGNAQLLSHGKYDVADLKIGNDTLSSLRVPQGWKVTLYQHEKCTGATKVFTHDTPFVGADFNDQTSSIDVQGCAYIFEHANYGGVSQHLTAGSYAMDALAIGNDKLSSVRVPSGWMVALYVHHHFTGDTAILTADTPYVGDVINDQISSIEVADGPRAIIFQHSNYSGNAKLLGLGQYDVNELGIGNDQLSSLRVPKGWEVVLYQHHNFTGAKRAYTADTPYVGDEFNDQTSSIIVKLAS